MLVALASTAEGCAEAYAGSLDALLPVVFAGCKDSVQAVREAACICIGQFAQYLQPEIITHYEQVLPHIFMVCTRHAMRTLYAMDGIRMLR